MSAPYLATWPIKLRAPSSATASKAATERDPWAVAGQTPGVLMDRINVGNQSGQQPNFIDQGRGEEEETRSLETVSTRYSVTYDAVGRPHLPGDGGVRQVELWREVLPATVYYRIKPSLAAEAFLEATVRVPDSMPLLAGPANIYAAGARLGEAQLSEKPPGANVILPFGVDQRVQVKRRTLDVSAGRKAFKQDGVSQAYRTTITNLTSEPIKLVLEERMPVSDDDRIKVTTDEQTTPGSEPSKERRGVRLWTLEMQAEETQQVDFAFTVQYPKEMRVLGLE